MKRLSTVLLAWLAVFPATAGTPAPVNPGEYPWSGHVKVTTNIGGACTGALVGRSTVITTAHCLFNKRTQAMLGAVSLHVLFNYDKGEFSGHALVKAVDAGAWLGAEGADKIARDWAILHLAAPAPESASVLPIADKVEAGTAARLAGFRLSKAHILTADTDCHIRAVRSTQAGGILIHDCAAERGVSGAPLLVRRDGRWAIAGLLVGHSPDAGLAVAVTSFAERLTAGGRKE